MFMRPATVFCCFYCLQERLRVLMSVITRVSIKRVKLVFFLQCVVVFFLGVDVFFFVMMM